MIPAKKEKNQQIQVFVRVRPLNKQEGNINITEFNSKNNKELNIKHHGHTKTYNFDRVFQPSSKQIDVYKLVAEPTVAEVMAGYNCTVLAYGQTGTGKTYTMAGGNPDIDKNFPTPTPWMTDEHAGIIPRTLAHLFDELRVHQIEFTVRVSYLELYNEEIFDLLSPLEDYTKLKLYDDNLKKGSVIVQGLTETTINTRADVYKLLEKGAEKRRNACTLMNSQSSRSHTVFCITVHTKENSIEGEDLLKTGKLYLVDLAGSENIKQSGATDLRAREAFNINQSLLTLGRCINKLTERATHIPYRESKLTRLLQDSLGGRTKTTLIATVSPAYCNVDETLNTLDYAFRAKSITNKPEINQRLSKKTLIKDYTEEIERLRKDLMATKRGTGIYLDEENYNTLTEERESHKFEIAEKINIIRMLEEEMCRKEQLCSDLKISLEVHQQTVDNLETKLDVATQKITYLDEENQLKEFFVRKLSETEEALKSTAKELITVADTTTSDTKKLHDKLKVIGDITKYNKMICEQQLSEFDLKIEGVNDNLRKLQDEQYHLLKYTKESLKTVQNTLESYNDHTDKSILKFVNYGSDTTNIINNINCDHMMSIKQLKEIQSSVSQDAVEQTTNLELDYVSKVLTKQEIIAKQIEEQHILFSNLHKYTEDILQNHFLQVTNYVKDALKEVEEAKLLMNTRHEKVISMCDVAQKNAIDATTREKEKQKDLEIKMSNIMTSMQEFQVTADEYFKENIKNDKQTLDHLKHIKLYETENKSKFELNHKKSYDLICNLSAVASSTETEHKKILTDYKTEETDQISNLNTAQSEFGIILKDYSNSSYNSCNNISNTCVTLLNEQMNLEEEHYERTTNAIDEVSKLLSTETQELCAQKDELYTNLNTNVDKILMSTNVFEQNSSQLESSMTTGLDTCREGFRKLHPSSLKEYKQTGQTPQRRFYKYPRTITETKPKEILIEEYQKIRSSSVTRVTNEKDQNEEKAPESLVYVRSSSESNIPRILKDTDENRGRENTKPNKDFKRQLSGVENIKNISTDNQ